MNNFNRMTIQDGKVFKMKPACSGYATDMAARRITWFVSAIARPLFEGSTEDCKAFIAASHAVLVEV